MGLALAIKRSYRFFVPPALLTPRKAVAQVWQPMFMYVIGLMTGMEIYARPEAGERIQEFWISALLVLLLLKWWVGRGDLRRWAA